MDEAGLGKADLDLLKKCSVGLSITMSARPRKKRKRFCGNTKKHGVPNAGTPC